MLPRPQFFLWIKDTGSIKAVGTGLQNPSRLGTYSHIAISLNDTKPLHFG